VTATVTDLLKHELMQGWHSVKYIPLPCALIRANLETINYVHGNYYSSLGSKSIKTSYEHAPKQSSKMLRYNTLFKQRQLNLYVYKIWY